MIGTLSDHYRASADRLHFALVPELSGENDHWYGMLPGHGSGYFRQVDCGTFTVLTADFTPAQELTKLTDLAGEIIEISYFDTQSSRYRVGRQGERAVQSGKRAFLAHGFEKASLKEICEDAGVTTGALYKRYKGKEDLFAAVVADTISDMENTARGRGDVDLRALTDQELLRAWTMDEASVLWWFEFLYQRKDGFVLLLKCAEGTSYSNFQHEWVEVLTGYSFAFLQEAQRRGIASIGISREELHILLTAFWATIYEPFIHDYTWEQIEAHCQIVCKLFDWHGALEFRLQE